MAPFSEINQTVICKWCPNFASYKIHQLCKTCFNYWNRTGVKRPFRFRNWDTITCANPNCKKPLRFDRKPTKRRCSACHYYRKSTGLDRPVRWTRILTEPGYEKTCKNPVCDKPVKTMHKWKHRRQGYCHACYTWRNDNAGENRPDELCPKAIPFGWCDCGAIAARVEAVTISGRGNAQIPLCEKCSGGFV